MYDTLFEEKPKLLPLTARFPGRCSLCLLPIYPGEDVIVHLEGEWVHDECAEDAGYEVVGNA